MLRQLKNLYRLPATINAIRAQLATQQVFLEENIQPILQAYRLQNDGSLQENDFTKITGYYGLAVPAILAENFARLHGKPLSPTERWIATCLGAMTGLFDDFFDVAGLNPEAVKEKIYTDDDAPGSQSNEKLFRHFYNTALKQSPNPAMLRDALFQVYEDQVASLQQSGNSLSEEETLSITLRKGGSSLLFYRSGIDAPLMPGEKECLYDLGGIMQLSNDIFDVYKDREAGVKTMMMFCNHVSKVEEYFRDALMKGGRKCNAMPFSLNDIQKLSAQFFLAIFSRSLVALEQLTKLEKKTGNEFKLETYSRKDLICDMDTKKNMLRSAAYFIQYCN